MVKVAQRALARAGREARRRRCADIVEDKQRCSSTSIYRKVYGGGKPPTAWALLGDEGVIACLASPGICPDGARSATLPTTRLLLARAIHEFSSAEPP